MTIIYSLQISHEPDHRKRSEFKVKPRPQVNQLMPMQRGSEAFGGQANQLMQSAQEHVLHRADASTRIRLNDGQPDQFIRPSQQQQQRVQIPMPVAVPRANAAFGPQQQR